MKVLELTFDEPEGATVAQDHSGHGHHATLLNGDRITTGRQGNCLYTLQGGLTEVTEPVIDFTGNFTVYFWLMCPYEVAVASSVVFYVSFSNLPDQILQLRTNQGAANWTLFALVKHNDALVVYTGGAKERSFSLPDAYSIPPDHGDMLGFIVANDYGVGVPAPYNEQAGSYIDRFTVHNGEAFGDNDINNLIVNQTTKVAYFIDGVDLATMGVRVEKATGLVGRPAVKTAKRYDWPDRHGVGVDIFEPRFEPRKIELDCWFIVNTKDEAIEKSMEIKEMMSRPGLRRFMFQGGSRYMPFDIYFPEEMDFEIPLWVDGGNLSARFTITMIEPQPVKRVLKFVRTNANQSTVTIEMETNLELFSIYWGDGQVTHNVEGQPASASHTYSSDGEYVITIAGTIERLTSFETNAVVVWPRLF